MRTLCDNYDAILLGEIGCDNQIDRMLEYTWGEDRLHTAYSFALMGDRYDADFIKSQLSPFVLNQDQSWPCWATSNHDVKRTASRWLPEGKSVAPSTYLQSYAVMLMTMLGTPCIYQGEELGLTEAELAFEDLVDPPGITFWPEYKGRDGCRTPMVWNKDENAGFSSCKPWLPVPSEHKSLDMSAQINDQESLLNFYRKLLKWRQKHSCISSGTFEFIHTVGENVLAFKRYDTEAEVQVFINFGKEPEVLAATTGTVVFGTKGDTLAPGEHKVIEI
jgi:alpha-glucosidase